MIPEHEIKIDTFRSKGKGGQNVNKVESAVRMTHIPTGIVVTCQDERDQIQNKKRAYEELCKRLQAYKANVLKSRLDKIRHEQLESGRVRTYDFTRNEITDHRRKTKTKKLKEVLDGNLDLVYNVPIA